MHFVKKRKDALVLPLLTLLLVALFKEVCLYAQQELFIYPTPLFSKVEKICNELITDFNALRFNNELSNAWIKDSDYLLNQLIILASTVEALIDNQEECKAYLLEDTYYLINLINEVEKNYSLLSKSDGTPYDTFTYLITISKQNLNSVITFNLERTLSF